MNTQHHVSVCACTYRRPELLKRLLSALRDQETGGLFTYSVVVVDNDAEGSAHGVVREFERASGMAVAYGVEARQSIALARNLAVRLATGHFLVFIDDDEFPIRTWLQILYTTCRDLGADGVLGPVVPYYDVEPPEWVLKGRFHDRPTYPTGTPITWRMGRTGNTFLRMTVFDGCARPFDPAFRTGEDQEFFYRAIRRGFRFTWCNEAVVYEVVPPIRWDPRFMVRRSLLRGAIQPQTPGFGIGDVLKSLVAAPVYLVALPFAWSGGRHRGMSVLVRLSYHCGKLLAFFGVQVVREAYVTE